MLNFDATYDFCPKTQNADIPYEAAFTVFPLCVPSLSDKGFVVSALFVALVPLVEPACTNPDLCRDEYTELHVFFRIYWGLTEVPRDIPSAARDVHLDHNQIERLPADAFENLTSCTDLDLGDNKISSIIPGAFNGLTKLSSLILTRNQISRFGVGTFEGLGNLKTLLLAYNLLTGFEPGLFDPLISIHVIRAYSNRIETLHPAPFTKLNTLYYLALYGKHLTTIHSGVFEGLSGLWGLTLDANPISSIEPNAFQGLTTLAVLRIVGTRLTSLDPEPFADLPRRPLRLGMSTPTSLPLWDCRSLCWAWKEANAKNITWYEDHRGILKPVCAGPVAWDDLQCDGAGRSRSNCFWVKVGFEAPHPLRQRWISPLFQDPLDRGTMLGQPPLRYCATPV